MSKAYRRSAGQSLKIIGNTLGNCQRILETNRVHSQRAFSEKLRVKPKGEEKKHCQVAKLPSLSWQISGLFGLILPIVEVQFITISHGNILKTVRGEKAFSRLLSF
jgi:hypothetical protein